MIEKKKEVIRKVERHLREGNVSLILDSYNDIFSDFDPRDYSERSVSDDFIVECQRAVREKDKEIELRLMIPADKRNLESEGKIKKRLKDHFMHHYLREKNEIENIKRTGFVWIAIGTIIMISGAFLLKYQGFIFDLLITVAEPAGWFTFWEGLGKIFIDSKEKSHKYDFYKKMVNTKLYFLSY